VARVDGVSTNSVPVELIPVDGSGSVVSGLTNLFAAVSRSSDGFQYDWDDGTFKAVPTEPLRVLVDTGEGQGIYHLAGWTGWTPSDLDETYTFTISQEGSPLNVANVPATWTMVQGPLVGASVMGTDLIDDLVVDPVDGLRDELYREFGVRQFRTYLVRRVWSDTCVGRGSMRVTQRQELIPAPDVVLEDTHELTPGGLQASGTATLHEVSLTYTQNQLLGEPLANNEEFHYLVVDGLGQGISRRLFIPADHPTPDREEGIGWDVKIRLVDLPTNVTAGDA
jgi:hypothetical protein